MNVDAIYKQVEQLRPNRYHHILHTKESEAFVQTPTMHEKKLQSMNMQEHQPWEINV